MRPLSGELALTAKLDYEAISKYHLVIQARDQGLPPRSSNITVVLNVLDVNDNKPEFDVQMYNVDVSHSYFLLHFIPKNLVGKRLADTEILVLLKAAISCCLKTR